MSETWEQVLKQWLRATFPMLAKHSQEMAKGDRGVMTLSIDVDEMQRMLAGEPGRLDPVWQPADEFIRIVRETTPSPISSESAAKWEQSLQVMDPRRDVALFLSSKTP